MGARRKNIVILGSTGTIGINTLDVIARHPEVFDVLGLSAHSNIALLKKQIAKFHPRYVNVGGEGIRGLFPERLTRGMKVSCGVDGLCEIAALSQADVVVIGISGSVALHPFLSAVRAKKTVAPANKEALVIAGELIMAEASRHGAVVIPVDSEQSAIFQCLQGHDRKELKQVYLTASGGPLADVPLKNFDRLTVERILRHPRWRMGKKITTDSATLMNKGFEVIEACRLFGLTPKQIQVVIHPQAVIHSMVEFCDKSVLAQLAVPDMRLPIQYALSYPKRLPSRVASIDFRQLNELTFGRPDLKKFPCLELALDVARRGGTFPAVLNAADEVAVEAFLRREISFTRIYDVVAKVVRCHRVKMQPQLEDILAAEGWAREEATAVVARSRRRT